MERSFRSLPHCTLSIRSSLRSARCHPIRCLSSTTARRTDGVYRELTAMRTRTPFIEAFRKQQENKPAPPTSTENVHRDLSPKSMSDSFTRVVRHMTSLLLFLPLTLSRSYHWLETHGSWTATSTHLAISGWAQSSWTWTHSPAWWLTNTPATA
jgi:hypothetical protein